MIVQSTVQIHYNIFLTRKFYIVDFYHMIHLFIFTFMIRNI